MGIFGFFGKKNNVKKALSKMENKDEFEAFCWGGVGIIFADGVCEDVEVEALIDMIQSDDKMSAYQQEVRSTVLGIVEQFKNRPTRAKLQVVRELSDLQSDKNAKENVLATLYDLAASNGIEEGEKETLIAYGKALCVPLSAIGADF